MDSNDFQELTAQVEGIYARDFHLGNFLKQMLHHLGNAHGLVLVEQAAPSTVAPAVKPVAAALSSDTDKRAATSTQGDK